MQISPVSRPAVSFIKIVFVKEKSTVTTKKACKAFDASHALSHYFSFVTNRCSPAETVSFVPSGSWICAVHPAGIVIS